MKTVKKISIFLFAAGIVSVSVFVAAVYAHCDTMSGPVIPEAKTALEKGDITPVLKWVMPEYEAELKAAFTLALQVRDKGPQAKELADRYFLETLIRLHRVGEGAPYTGIKETPPDKIILMADQALAAGSADEMIKAMQAHLAAAVQEKFSKVLEAAKDKDTSIHAGREYVRAYVQYTHYVEGIHAALTSAGDHHGAETETNSPMSEPAEHAH